MLIGYKLNQTSIVLRVKILDSSVGTGAGKTGLTSASAGMIIGTIVDNESTSTAYTVAGSTIESIATLGTYAAPTATKCRFKEVDATNHKGIYELQIADDRFGVASAKSLLVSISGAANAADCDVVIPLRGLDPYDGVRGGMTAIPNAAAGANGGLPLGDANARVDVSKVAGTTQTARDLGAQLDAAVSTRLAAASYTAPDNTNIGIIVGRTDVATSTRLASASYTAPDNTTIGIIATALTALAGKFTGITLLASWLRLLIRSGATDATALGEINTGGTGAFAPATESLEYIANNLSGGAGDWTSGERSEIRERLGITGTTAAPGGTPSLATAASVSALGSPAQASSLTTLAAKFAGITLVGGWLRTLARKTASDATALGEINTGGTGTFVPSTMSLEVLPSISGGGGGGSDPLLNEVPGSYAAGTAGAALGRIGTGTINVVSPLSASGDLTLIAGDDYLDADSRALSFTNSAGTWPNLTGATITLVAIRNGSTLIEVTGSVVTPTGSQSVKVEPTAADLAPPSNASASWEYIYGVYATLSNGHKVTLQTGKLTLQRAH
jgi:hypothetical protein